MAGADAATKPGQSSLYLFEGIAGFSFGVAWIAAGLQAAPR